MLPAGNSGGGALLRAELGPTRGVRWLAPLGVTAAVALVVYATFLGTVAVINGINMFDGLDGLASGRLLAPLGFVSSGLQYTARCRGDHTQAAFFCQWLQQEAEHMPAAPSAP